jgi:hypothetical protein
MMCVFVKEGQYPPPPTPAAGEGRPGSAVRSYFRECFSQPYYRWCFAAIALGTVTFIPVNTFSIYYAKQLNVDMGYYGKLVTASYVCSLVLAYALGWLVDRFSALAIGTIALCVYAFAGVWGMLNIHNAATFGVALVAHTVLSGLYFTSTAPLPQSLLPRAKFAQFNSAAGMLTAVATMTLGPTLGFILDRTGSNYRLTFAAGLMLSIVSVVAMLGVYRRYQRYVGPNGYVAPGDVIASAATPR